MGRLERGPGSLGILHGSPKSVCSKVCWDFYLGHMFSSHFLQSCLRVSKWVQGSREPFWVHGGTIQAHTQGWEMPLSFGMLLCTSVTVLILVHAWVKAQGLADGAAAQTPAVTTAVLWTSFSPDHAWSFRWDTFSWHYRGSPVHVTQGLKAINCAAKAIFWFQFNFAFACGLDSRMFIFT